ncbi:MAG: glycoside hydrolase family 127 protein [Oscillospiraceae bacterium]|jgi:hypothetical protein|nr:glycoside hydrolase family 127 protein [Oscillospiraceae bacterium]
MELQSTHNLCLRGDIGRRTALNIGRLEGTHWRASTVFSADSGGWPGDWEGRTILALCLHAAAAGREPAYLQEILDALPGKLNEKGYMGPIHTNGVLDEQQLSGHNWLLRGLMAVLDCGHRWAEEATVRGWIDGIIENLYLPATGSYASYPCTPEERRPSGDKSGSIEGQIGCWRISSDTGCAFMSLDALAEAYARFKNPKVLELLEDMVAAYNKLDFLGAKIQTHATLSAARGIVKLYRTTGEEKYLNLALRVYTLYIHSGMTETYANDNWFGRPEWTEPCAIVDSLLLAWEFFTLTGQPKYADLAHRIWLNGLGHAQRPNGGFGCDSCVGGERTALSCHGVGDAYWCCSMRGAEGLYGMARSLFLDTESDPEVRYYNDCVLQYGNCTITERTGYPNIGKVQFTFKHEGTTPSFVMKLFLPGYANKYKLTVNGNDYRAATDEKGLLTLPIDGNVQEVILLFDIPQTTEKPLRGDSNPNAVKHFKGHLLLGKESDDGELKPINDTCERSVKTLENRKLQVLFPGEYL